MGKMENILQFFSIWQKLKVTVSTLFTAPRDFKFSETLFFTHCHIRANFATLRSEKVAYHFTLSYLYTVQCAVISFTFLFLWTSRRCIKSKCRYKINALLLRSLKRTTGQNMVTNLAILGLYQLQTIIFGHRQE